MQLGGRIAWFTLIYCQMARICLSTVCSVLWRHLKVTVIGSIHCFFVSAESFFINVHYTNTTIKALYNDLRFLSYACLIKRLDPSFLESDVDCFTDT